MTGGISVNLLISSIQKMVLYETKARYYLVGCNNTQKKFRVLKIDRTEARDLIVVDDRIEYSEKEIKDLLTMIDVGNRPKPGQKGNPGLSRTVSAFGIVGFVRFLEGYYIILITKRRRIASIGHHTVYKIEDTSMIYIPNDTVRYSHADESRYVKMFQNVDLSSNFYFSYSYDLTHTLQYNLTVPHSVMSFMQTYKSDLFSNKGCCSRNEKLVSSETNKENKNVQQEFPKVAIRTKPKKKYAWNAYLLSLVEDSLHSDWLLYVIHGFIGQSNISIFGRPIFLTIIARRSNKYAGTRFLKRGANSEGDVANEVETEQIVYDSSRMSFDSGRFTSFLQMRGSIPSHWSQDISKMVPKPTIILDLGDPFCCTGGLHFNQLLRRYGSPIIVLNLVKKREKKKHESTLSEVYTSTIEYLNQFISDEHRIIHRSFDMARINKGKEANVMPGLAKIAYKLVKKTGIFQSCKNFFCHTLRPHRRWLGMQGKEVNDSIVQTGVVRVNCVDCLDRTNTAQFALGKVALAFQLYTLGVLDKPELEFESDTIRMLEELYEDHGDTLALQYGGSQLVHRIKTYRKTAPWTSQSRDIMQTLSRYYSNAFSDADKQNAINLFLGVFAPEDNRPNIWDLPTDYYLHHPTTMGRLVCHRRSYTQWWESGVAEHLPLPYEDAVKGTADEVEVVLLLEDDERRDSYVDFYRPFELSVMSEMSVFVLAHSVRDFMPNFTTDFSPFSVRIRPGKRREEMGKTSGTSNPSLTGQSSTSSTASSSTSSSAGSGDSSTTSSEDESVSISDQYKYYDDDSSSYVSFRSLFPSMKRVYGMETTEPSQHDVQIYKRYTNIGSRCSPVLNPGEKCRASPNEITLIRQSAFSLDTTDNVTPPTVNKKSKELYKTYVHRGETGNTAVSHSDHLLYKRYECSKFR